MKQQYTLQLYYENYLRTVRKVSDSTIKHYTGALSSISKRLKCEGKVENSIYEVENLTELEIIRTYLLNDIDFIELDSRGHQMYSAAINNYYRFALGDDFTKRNYDVRKIDLPLEKKVLQVKESMTYQRSTIIKNQALKAANYECECDHSHKTFTNKTNMKPYMEAHHLIPIKFQDDFQYSLDVYANLVSLCPICHRLLHYGIDSEKKDILLFLYGEREKRLYESGIEIIKNDFLELTM